MRRSHPTAALGAALLLAALPAAAAMQEPAPWVAPARKAREASPLGPSRANLQRGKELFAANCLVCHGEGGKGDGPAAAAFQPRPRDLSAAEAMEQSDGALFWKIGEGRAPMPSFKASIPDEDRWRLVQHLRALELRARWDQPLDRAAAAYEMLRNELLTASAARLADGADGLAGWVAEVPLPEAKSKDAAAAKAWADGVAAVQKSCGAFASLPDAVARADAFDRLSRSLQAWMAVTGITGKLPLHAQEQAGPKGHGPWLWLQSAEKPVSPYTESHT